MNIPSSKSDATAYEAIISSNALTNREPFKALDSLAVKG